MQKRRSSPGNAQITLKRRIIGCKCTRIRWELRELSGQTWRGRAASPADPRDESVPNRASNVGGKARRGRWSPDQRSLLSRRTESDVCVCAPRWACYRLKLIWFGVCEWVGVCVSALSSARKPGCGSRGSEHEPARFNLIGRGDRLWAGPEMN